jgi:cytochrome c-type biogenesis protein CcmH/NrfF
VQTLDVHESELADKLRHEIHLRMDGGEAATSIEEDLVQRFGEKIRAVPAGADPRSWIPLLVLVSMLGVFSALLWVGVRWTRPRQQQLAHAPLVHEELTRYDALLDRELTKSPHHDDAA